ncbi:MAG TPA: thioredoxin fold domain-containing protein [Fibrobacteria bacterium]|nr:thioredoxin fold domain-containing protein [Fibrobacteria bacterium]HOX50686.1 thioredoxin fold domain-containing protein [Fibrobacteria bacterium]
MNRSRAAGFRFVAGLVFAMVLVGLATPAHSQAQGPSSPAVKWSTLEQATKTAKTAKKGVFVMVYADWCGYCHQMDATTFRDPNVIARINASFVPAKLNGESGSVMTLGKRKISENQWAMEQGVQGFPALVVLDSKSRVVVQYPGFMSAPQARQFLGDLAEFFRKGGIDKLGNFLDWAEARS